MLEEDDNMEKSNTLRVPQIPISRLSSNSSHSAESGFGGSNSDLSPSGFQTENKYSRRHSFSVTGFTNAFSFPENVLSETIMKRSPSMIDIMNFEENIKIFKEDSTIPEKEISIEYLRKIIERGIQRKNKRLIETALSLASDNNMKIICREFCKKKPQVCFVSHTIMKKIKHRVITEFRNKCEILSVWIGRNVKKAFGIDTIVLVTKAPKPCVMSNYFWGLYLKIRCASECSNEASHLLVYDMNDLNGSLGIQIKDIEINKLLICHSNITLIKTSNVCSIGFKRKTHRIEWVPSIVIYCHVKGVIPIGENAFPTRIGGHRVDVREAVCEFSGQPAQISEQIGSEDMKTTGTLGGFVTLQNPNRHAFLTCAHVVLPSDVLKKGRAIEYTKRRDIKVLTKNACQIGNVTKAIFSYGRTKEVSVDAALVEIKQDRLPTDGKFANVYHTEQFIKAGFSECNIPQFAKGEIEQVKPLNFRKPVLKIGAKSGMTIGSLKIGNCCANVSHYDVHYDVHTTNNMADSITLCKQMEVLPHFDPSQTSDSWDSFLDYGDSGSFVFFISQEDPLILKCIGLAVAKTSYGSCLMTPIDKVLDALDLPHNCLSKFTPNVSHEETKADILSILNDLSRKIATKDDIEKLENEMHKINERLSATESEVIMLITEKTKEAS